MQRLLLPALALVCSGFLSAGDLAFAEDEAPAPEIADIVETCTSCHGADGYPSLNERPIVAPIIWGQEEYYLYVQLRDFASGLRVNERMTTANELMKVAVSDLTKEQMKALAKYYSKKKWPYVSFRAEAGDKAIADLVATAGQCTQCHLGAYTGNSRVPRLAGQSADYLAQTMIEFKTGIRKNAPDMASLVKVFPDDQLEAVGRYLAGLQVVGAIAGK